MNRSVLVDSLKVLASQVIVLHHLCLYAPMAVWLEQAWPGLIGFIVEDGRLAVQPFLVMGGFLAVQSLLRRRDCPVRELALQRYLRLALPLGLALLLLLTVTLMVGSELSHEEWVSPLPSLSVLLAHLLLLQDVLGVPSLLAGAWYVAIDFQLFVLLALLMHAAHRLPPAYQGSGAPALLGMLTLASVFVFSREPGLDMWALYFFSAYGLGALAAWTVHSPRARGWWWAAVALLLVDWLVAPRDRPIWACVTALALHAGAHVSWHARAGALGRVIRGLSFWSYGVFICHFAVIVMVSGWWEMLNLSGLPAALLACALVLVLSLSIGVLVQALGERLAAAWGRRLRMQPRAS